MVYKLYMYLNPIFFEAIIRLCKHAGHGTKQAIAEALDSGQEVTLAGLGAGLKLLPPVLIAAVHVQRPQAVGQWPYHLIGRNKDLINIFFLLKRNKICNEK